MLQEHETEYKAVVNRQQFEQAQKLCNKLLFMKSRNVQVNYYYDTENNDYNLKKQTIRVRQNKDGLKLQIKYHKMGTGLLQVSDEYTTNINSLPYVLQQSCFKKHVFLKGCLTTERTVYPFGENSRVCLDCNMYLGVCDYEIEIEFVQADKGQAAEMIKKLNLDSFSKKSKSARFFDRLEQLAGKIENQ